MLVRDVNTGRLVALPDKPAAPLGYNEERLGLPILAALPALAAKALPIITSILPMLGSKGSSSPPAAASAPAALPAVLPPAPPPAPVPAAVPLPMPTAQTIAPSPPVDSANVTSAVTPPLTATTRTSNVDTEVVVAPVPVRQPNGQITVVPMRVRRRRRRRQVRTMRVAPPSMQLSEVSKEQVPMMVHDQLSGYVHEVPDTLMGPALGEVVYDGLGNPVGWNPFSAITDVVRGAGNVIKNVVGGAANALPLNMIPGVGTAIRHLLPGGIPGLTPPPAGMPAPYPAPGAMYPYQPPYGTGPVPAGWQRSNLPYTGLGPRRMYMRCAVWPGPQGLVPTHAANMPPGFPGATPGAYGVRRRRRHRR
jgi:hypothetical protein